MELHSLVAVRVKDKKGLEEEKTFYPYGVTFVTSFERAMELFKEGKVLPIDNHSKLPPFVEKR